MLAAHLSRLNRASPVRYAVDPLSPLSLLVRSRLLSNPLQQHEGMVPMWREMGHNLPGLLDAIHGGHHEQFPAFLHALQQHVANLQQHDPGYTLRAYQRPELLHAMRDLYHLRAEMPQNHAMQQAYEQGSIPDTAGNMASFTHLMRSLQDPNTRRVMQGLADKDRSAVNRILHPLTEQSRHSLPRLLQAHTQLGQLLLPHGSLAGPFPRVAPLTSGAITANIRDREISGERLHQQHQRAEEEQHPMWHEYHSMGGLM